MSDLNDDDLAGLSQAERDMLADLKDSDAGHDRLASDVDADDGDDGEGDQGDQGGAKATDAEAGDDDQEGKHVETPEVSYTAEAPDDLDEQIKALATERKTLRRQYEEGELSEDEYDERMAQVDDQRDALKASQIKAQVAQEMHAQALQKSYKATLDGFFADAKRAGFDYHAEGNREALKFLDGRVRLLAQSPHEQNPESWRELLDEANMLTARKFKFDIKPVSGKANQGATGKPASKARNPDLSNMPPTIGRGPGAASASVADGGGEFGYLDSLSGIALEAAVAKMSPEQLERYKAA